jgi:hypothetical protein
MNNMLISNYQTLLHIYLVASNQTCIVSLAHLLSPADLAVSLWIDFKALNTSSILSFPSKHLLLCIVILCHDDNYK